MMFLDWLQGTIIPAILKEETELDPSVHTNVLKDITEKDENIDNNKDDATINTKGNGWLAGC